MPKWIVREKYNYEKNCDQLVIKATIDPVVETRHALSSTAAKSRGKMPLTQRFEISSVHNENYGS